MATIVRPLPENFFILLSSAEARQLCETAPDDLHITFEVAWVTQCRPDYRLQHAGALDVRALDANHSAVCAEFGKYKNWIVEDVRFSRNSVRAKVLAVRELDDQTRAVKLVLGRETDWIVALVSDGAFPKLHDSDELKRQGIDVSGAVVDDNGVKRRLAAKMA